MDWFISLTRVVMKTEWPENHPFTNHRSSTETEAVKLFKAMLRFEMECTCRTYDTHPVVCLAGDMIQLGDWQSKLENIKTLDSRISENLQRYQLSELTEYSSQMVENTEDLLVEVRQIKILYADVKQFKADKDIAKLICRFGKTTYFDQMRLNPERHRGTCKWFRGHAKYREWLKSTRNDLLLVTAEPGCGKSVLSRCLIEQDLPSRRQPGNNTEPIVCYFFFKDNTIQGSLINGLGAIIHQLLIECKDTAAEFAKEINSMSDEMLQGPDTLWRLFEGVSKHKTFENRTIYCVFDALDECAEDDRTKLISLLQSHLNTKRRIQFLVTSRPYPSIVEAFQDCTEKPVCLEGEGDKEKDDLQKEIDIVFRCRIESLVESKRLSGEVASLLNNKLLTKGAGQRTYLWVRLVFELLKKATPGNLNDWNALLDDLPEGVPGAYDKLLSNVSPEYCERVLSLLHIIYVAYRPLTLREANIAVQIRGKYYEKSMKSLGLDDQSFRTWLRKECGFFITEYDGRLFLIHQTAREFLIGSNFTKSDDKITKEKASSELAQADSAAAWAAKPNKAWRNSIKSEEEAHFVMAECCLASMMVTWQDPEVQKTAAAVEDAYYKFNESLQGSKPHEECPERSPKGIAENLIKVHVKILSKTNDFFSYSLDNWSRHFSDANPYPNESEATPERRSSADMVYGLLKSRPAWYTTFSLSENNPKHRPLADTKPLLAAYWLFIKHPVRSVLTSQLTIGHLEYIERDIQRLPRSVWKWIEQRDSSFVVDLQNLLTQVEVATVLRCSPLPWACIFIQPWLVSSLLGKSEEGGLQMLCSTCQHSEELEVLLAITVTLSIAKSGPFLTMACIFELLRYEEQKLSGHPERVKYYLDLLRFVRLGLPDSSDNWTLRELKLHSFVLNKMAEKWAVQPAKSNEDDGEVGQ
jgi:N-terminal domain of NWD NACHT-NTPase/NACHT domain